MIFAQLEDLTGGAEMVIFPKLYQTVADMIVDGAKLIIEGKVSDKDAEKKLLADKVFILDKNILLSLPTLTASKRRGGLTGSTDIVIHLPESFSRESLLQLKATLAKYHAHDGGVGVHIVVNKEGKVSKITTSFKIIAEPRTLNELTAIVGLRSVRQAQ
jgi:DNA polymerase III alpha subunit